MFFLFEVVRCVLTILLLFQLAEQEESMSGTLISGSEFIFDARLLCEKRGLN